jgi:hypothetical protein
MAQARTLTTRKDCHSHGKAGTTGSRAEHFPVWSIYSVYFHSRRLPWPFAEIEAYLFLSPVDLAPMDCHQRH